MTNVAYKIVFPGPPIPLARPRIGKWGAYDSQKDLKKKTIECLLQQQSNWKKLEGALGMRIEFHMLVPISLTARKQVERLQAYHISKPDLSNLLKFYEDVMEGYLYDNDSQIMEVTACKVNSLNPQTVIQIWQQRVDDLEDIKSVRRRR